MWGTTQRDQKFFDTFAQQAVTIARAAKLLLELLGEGPRPAAHVVGELGGLEQRGNQLVQDTIVALQSTWMTPFDRSDIRSIVSTMDDVLDGLFASGARVELLGLQPFDSAISLATRVETACTLLLHAACLLRDLHRADDIMRYCEQVNRIESDGDLLYRRALAQLYDAGAEADPLDTLKRREVLDVLESTLDRCEDLADVISGIVVEYA